MIHMMFFDWPSENENKRLAVLFFAFVILLKDEISIRLGGNLSVVMSAEDTEKYNRAIQELQQNNVVMANALVNQLLQKPENKNSARILELQKRIKARM